MGFQDCKDLGRMIPSSASYLREEDVAARASCPLAEGVCNYLRDSRFIQQVMEYALDPVESSTIIISLFSLGTDGAELQ